MTDSSPVQLTPLQQRTLGLLRRAPDPVVFDAPEFTLPRAPSPDDEGDVWA